MVNRSVLLDLDFDFFTRESPILDWGHNENMLFGDMIWKARAMHSPKINEWLTSPVDVSPTSFWDDLMDRGWHFDPKCKGFAADSHETVGAAIPTLTQGGEWEIWHFDAHHDLGYDSDKDLRHLLEQRFCCDNFLYVLPHFFPQITKIVVVYPEWRRNVCPITGMDAMWELHPFHNPESIERIRESLPDTCDLEVTFYQDHKTPVSSVQSLTIAQSSCWTPPWWDSIFAQVLEEAPGKLKHAFGPNKNKKFQPRSGWPTSWEESFP